MNVTYADVIMMPTCERRFYLGLLVKKKNKEREMVDGQKNSTGKGKRQSSISGSALKSKIKTGEIPLN